MCKVCPSKCALSQCVLYFISDAADVNVLGLKASTPCGSAEVYSTGVLYQGILMLFRLPCCIAQEQLVCCDVPARGAYPESCVQAWCILMGPP